MGVDAADINNDGWLDVMVLDMVAEDNYRLKANMSAMNPDAFWDVVDNGGHYQYMFNTLQLNLGNEHFSEIGQLTGISSTDWSWANLIADFDNDGLKDIYVTNGLLRDIRNTDSDKKFGLYVQKVINDFVQNNPNAGEVSIWDILDLDEALKILPSEKLSNYVYKNKGDLRFSKSMQDWGLDQKSFSNGAVYADLDNDGDLDLVVNNVNEPAFIYQNNADQLFNHNYLRVRLKDGSKNTVLGAKIKIEYNDQIQFYEMTNVRGIYSTCEQTAHFGLGKTKTIDRLSVIWPDNQISELHNVKVNQLITLDKNQTSFKATTPTNTEKLFSNITAQTSIRFKHRENNFDDYQKQILLPHKMSQFGPCLAVADVNNDGLDDFFVGGAANSVGNLFVQQPDGLFIPFDSPWDADKICEDIGAAFIDVDGDQDMDLYVVSGGNVYESGSIQYQDRLYLNNGKGIFQKSLDALPEITSSGSKVIPADFDQDGDMDLFVGGRHVPHDYPAPADSYILLNEGGKFVDITQEIAPELKNLGLVTDAQWSDYDQDNDLDLIISGEWMPITIFNNNQGKFKNITQELGLSNSTGWWFSIEKADMDNDGDEDYLVGNLGLNYKYKASQEEPFGVHYDDFDENGSKDIVLSYYNFGNLYPLRGRSCSSSQVPEIKKKFENYSLFANAKLEDVYGKNKLQKALQYEAKNFASVYLENLGNGKFKTHELPIEAQFSSINDFLIQDFDQDDNLDVLIINNLYVSEIETPRNDAGTGLFMKGDGQGNFTPIPVNQSGFFVPFDSKEVKLIRDSKGTLILVATNDDFLQIFRNNQLHNAKN